VNDKSAATEFRSTSNARFRSAILAGEEAASGLQAQGLNSLVQIAFDAIRPHAMQQLLPFTCMQASLNRKWNTGRFSTINLCSTAGV